MADGDNISLNHLEHEIIRKQFKDPRIHVALVCAAKSCPPLLNRAYRADDLDKVLDENMKRFVTDASRNQIDDEKRELRLSKIFEWYPADFGGKDRRARLYRPLCRERRRRLPRFVSRIRLETERATEVTRSDRWSLPPRPSH